MSIKTLLALSLFFPMFSQSTKYQPIAKDGQIILIYPDNTQQIISPRYKCTDPVISENQTYIAFVGNDENIKPSNLMCDNGNQIWLFNINTKKLIQLLASKESKNPKLNLCGFSNLQFSPDSIYLYFESSAWVTSHSVHRIHLNSLKEEFVSDGNGYEILSRGKFKGFIIAGKHKYYQHKPGSYDWNWLLTPDGNEIMHIGKEIDSEIALIKFKRKYAK